MTNIEKIDALRALEMSVKVSDDLTDEQKQFVIEMTEINIQDIKDEMLEEFEQNLRLI